MFGLENFTQFLHRDEAYIISCLVAHWKSMFNTGVVSLAAHLLAAFIMGRQNYLRSLYFIDVHPNSREISNSCGRE